MKSQSLCCLSGEVPFQAWAFQKLKKLEERLVRGPSATYIHMYNDPPGMFLVRSIGCINLLVYGYSRRVSVLARRHVLLNLWFFATWCSVRRYSVRILCTNHMASWRRAVRVKTTIVLYCNLLTRDKDSGTVHCPVRNSVLTTQCAHY